MNPFAQDVVVSQGFERRTNFALKRSRATILFLSRIKQDMTQCRGIQNNLKPLRVTTLSMQRQIQTDLK